MDPVLVFVAEATWVDQARPESQSDLSEPVSVVAVPETPAETVGGSCGLPFAPALAALDPAAAARQAAAHVLRSVTFRLALAAPVKGAAGLGLAAQRPALGPCPSGEAAAFEAVHAVPAEL